MLESIFKKKISKMEDTQSDAKTLSDVKNGESVRVECLRGKTSDCQRLREMGFCELAKVVKVTGSRAMVCKVCDTKVVISEELAKNVIIADSSQDNEERDV